MEELKKLAAEEAVKLVKDGMVVGLGTGSTAKFAVEALKDKDIRGIPTSKDTAALAESVGIKLIRLHECDSIDIAIDGADQVDPDLNLIKGGGGALTREKIIDSTAKQFIVITDESKMVDKLTFPLPVEVLDFGWTEAKKRLEALGAKVTKRDFITDNGNLILDCRFSEVIPELGEKISQIPGVVEHGIFPKEMVTKVIVGTSKGVKVYEKRG